LNVGPVAPNSVDGQNAMSTCSVERIRKTRKRIAPRRTSRWLTAPDA
jgi:hypothetical protein